ncbi:MAG: Ig-like domain-containing protein [Bacilli bacterium]|nr:Ig-like domain-containing protein [Bacilli bacterium]
MKKNKVVLPVMALMLAAGLAGCQGGPAKSQESGGPAPTSSVAPSSVPQQEKINITAENGKTALEIDETVKLTASVEGATFTSGNTKVATVSGNVVTAVSAGTAVITAKKEGYKNGTITITVKKAPLIATLHWEDADHYSADGWWSNSNRGPGATPVYSKSAASDGTCIGYFGEGDKEALSFTSDKAVEVELVLTMGHNDSFADLSTAFKAKFNDVDLSLKDIAYDSDSDGQGGYSFAEVSIGKVNLKIGKNTLAFEMLGNVPYLDDLMIYSKQTAAVTVDKAPAKTAITVAGVDDNGAITVEEGKTVQLTPSVAGCTYTVASETTATVDESGLVSGVAKGSTTVIIKKEGYISVQVTINVTEKVVEGEIKLEAEDGTHPETLTTRLASTGETITDAWPEGDVLTVKFNASEVKSMSLYLNGRGASSGYSTVDVDLATAIEVKVNNAALSPTGTVSGRTFNSYLLGTFNTMIGENTITVKNLSTAPVIDFFKIVPNA